MLFRVMNPHQRCFNTCEKKLKWAKMGEAREVWSKLITRNIIFYVLGPGVPRTLRVLRRSSHEIVVRRTLGEGNFSGSRLFCIPPSQQKIRPIDLAKSTNEEDSITLQTNMMDSGSLHRWVSIYCNYNVESNNG